MSLIGLFDIGKSAMLASQTALSTTGHNIANAETPGFSRQDVVLESATPVMGKGGLIGAGVTVSDIRRSYDSFIQSQLIYQQQNLGRSDAMNQSFSTVEEVFNEEQEMGLSNSLNDYFSAWNQVVANPEGQAERSQLIQKATGLTSTAKEMERTITEEIEQINGSMDDDVNQINSITKDIAQLNGRIVETEAGQNGVKANDMRDQRDNLLSQLSNLIEVNSYENSDGSVTVTAGAGILVSGEQAGTMSTQANQDGDKDIYLNGINITTQINRGQLGGLIEARADIESGPLLGLRKLVASITLEVNQLHTAGYGLDGTTDNDFFNPLQPRVSGVSQGATATATITDPSQVTLDEYAITFDASGNYYVRTKESGTLVTSGTYSSASPITFGGMQVVITGTITAGDSFSVSPLTNAVRNFGVALTDPQKIAAASHFTAIPGDNPGDNTNAVAIAGLQQSNIASLGNSTFADYYKGIVNTVGTMSGEASDSLNFDQNLLTQIENRQQSGSGVSLDEEAANLIKFQRAFEAGAMMIKVTDELLQTLLNL
jgi:flagellar hook-associated protein 1 FlgK